MNLSRDQKNRLLVALNVAMIGIALAKLRIAPELLSRSMRAWLWIAPLVIAVRWLPGAARARRAVDALLFLLTGASVGLTLGSVIRSPATAWLVEWMWLALSLGVVAAHYSRSSRDDYLP